MHKQAAARLLIVSFTLIFATLACNLPGNEVQPTSSEPTPNMTMTALFNIVTKAPSISTPIVGPSPTQGIGPSATPPIPTNTVPPVVISTATSQPLATNTPKPTAEVRTAGKVVAEFLSTAPKLDGVWDEWNTTAYPARFIVYGSGEVVNKEDLEGSYRVGWDDSNLYLAVKVYDDLYVQNASGAEIFKGDSIELLFDVDLMGDVNSTELNSDDYQLAFSPGKGGVSGDKETYLYYPSSVAGSRTQVKIASTYGGGVLRAEISIPWSVLGVSPTSGKQFGFAVSMSDNDNNSQNIQQSMVSNIKNRSLTNPTTWAILELKK